MVNIFLALEGSRAPLHAIDLEFPLKGGDFSVVQGGANQIINHHFHISAQKYAIDVVQLNHFGIRENKLNPKNLEDFNIYGAIVYSPCNGVVVKAVDDYPDLTPPLMDPENPAGNYLAISKKDSDVIVILAHLKQGSLKVKNGESVSKGQALAQVGNSGNTSEPHLHIHSVLNHTGDFLFTGQGVPMTFKNRFLVRNDRI